MGESHTVEGLAIAPARDVAAALRVGMLGVVLLGLVGTEIELLLIGHIKGVLQIIPIVGIGCAVAAVALHAGVQTRAALSAFRSVMIALIVVGALGVALHFKSSLELQREMDSTLPFSRMALKALRSEAPPALAPGVLSQIGLLGLIATYRDPRARRAGGCDPGETT